MDDSIKLLYFSIDEWGNRGRRKPRFALELSGQPEVASLLYVCPPATTNLLSLLRSRPAEGSAGRGRVFCGETEPVTNNLWTYQGTTHTFPLTRFEAVRARLQWLARVNRRLYFRQLRRHLSRLPGSRLVIWLNHPIQAGALDAFRKRALLCYDWTDDWAQFAWQPVENHSDVSAWNDRILREADLVFAVSDSLAARAQQMNRHTYLMPNATDMQAFDRTSGALAVPSEIGTLPHPIIGYVGQLIAERMDIDLIRLISQRHPEGSLVFVGPTAPHCQEVFNDLSHIPNVHLVGSRPYGDLPGLMSQFDVCILPHVVSGLTQSMDPIKLYDYMATGKPIVTTSVAGVERFADVLYVAQTTSAFLEQLVLALNENGALRERRLAYAHNNTWPERAQQVWDVLRARLAVPDGQER